jgi:hypothetical protein
MYEEVTAINGAAVVGEGWAGNGEIAAKRCQQGVDNRADVAAMS